MLMRGLSACKRKGKAPDESSKKARVDIPIFMAPISAMGAPEITPEIEVPPIVEFGTTIEAAILRCHRALVPRPKFQSLPPEGRKRLEKRRPKGP